ncbi:MAG: hypothetical protein IJR99_09750, partial [Kiritimatiellae bacterium]|nr:hypothetical protein [Kiritimatiellia bacterium]
MNGKIVKLGFLTVSSILVLAGGCAKEDYRDPVKFAEKYIRADLEKNYPRELWKKMQYSDVVLENVTSSMTESFFGPLNKITCGVRVVPEPGVQYYHPADLDWNFTYGLGSELRRDEVAKFLPETRVKRLKEGASRIFDKKPLLVSVARYMSRSGPSTDTISCYRTRNENGVFVPMKVGGSDEFNYQGVGGFFNTDYLFTDRSLKERGGLKAFSEEGRKAYGAFSNRCETIRAKIHALNELAEGIRGVTNVVRWGKPSFVQARREELSQEQVAPLESELGALSKTLAGHKDAVNRQLRDIKRQTDNCAYEARRVNSAQENLAKNLANVSARLERAKADLERESRPRQQQYLTRTIDSLNVQSREIAGKRDNNESQLQKIAKRQEELKAADQKLRDEYTKEKAQTDAKVVELKRQIAGKKEAIEKVVAEEAQAKLNQLTKE